MMVSAQGTHSVRFRTVVVAAGLVITVLSLAAEVACRVVGLGDPVIYETHADYGYRLRPNQNVRRFGGRQCPDADPWAPRAGRLAWPRE